MEGMRFELRRCTNCGSAVTVGGEAAAMHESGAYRAGDPRLYRLVRPLLVSLDRRRLALLSAHVAAPARLLDAGAGRGRFVASARAAGYDAFGIEPSARGADAAAGIGAPVARVSIEQASIQDGSLDVVTLWHVLEHLEDPGDALDRIAAWLRPGGLLLVGVPNIASLQARIGGERWYHLDVPRHRVHFTERGIQQLLRRHGFTPVRTDHMLLEHNPFGMWQSLVNRMTTTPSYLYNVLKRNASLHPRDLFVTVLALALAPLAALLELAAGGMRRGGTIAVIARRGAERPGELP